MRLGAGVGKRWEGQRVKRNMENKTDKWRNIVILIGRKHKGTVFNVEPQQER